MITSTAIHSRSLCDQFIMFHGCWYLVNYIPQSNDSVSQSIIRYKQNDPKTVKSWNNLAAKHIIQLDIRPDYIVRALGSREMVCFGNRPLDRLCEKVSNHYGIKYDPYLLMKKDFTRPMHRLSKKERQKELRNKYVFNLNISPDKPTILIIDDVVTTGTTIYAILEAIKKIVPLCEIYFFAFAKTRPKKF